MIAVDFTVSVTDKTPIETLAAKKLGAKSIKRYVIIKKSVDARKKDNVLYNYRVAVEVDDERKFIGKGTPYDETNIPTIERMTIGRKINCNPVVVGSGPAGLFAALTLALLGAKPVSIQKAVIRNVNMNNFFPLVFTCIPRISFNPTFLILYHVSAFL